MSMFADDCMIHYSGHNWNTIQKSIQKDPNALSVNLEKHTTNEYHYNIRNKLSNLKRYDAIVIDWIFCLLGNLYNYL